MKKIYLKPSTSLPFISPIPTGEGDVIFFMGKKIFLRQYEIDENIIVEIELIDLIRDRI